MIDVIKKTILAGVGAALTTTEKAEAALQEMVRQGKLSAADARIIAEKIAEQGRREFEEMSQDLGAKVRAMLDRSDAETKARLTALEERGRMLEMNATPPPSRSSEP
jgi:polyhydroxyalkanoate synthesis regulator phasin